MSAARGPGPRPWGRLQSGLAAGDGRVVNDAPDWDNVVMAQAPERVDRSRENVLAGRVDGFVWDSEGAVRFEVAMEALNRVMGTATGQLRRALGAEIVDAVRRDATPVLVSTPLDRRRVSGGRGGVVHDGGLVAHADASSRSSESAASSSR